MKGRFILIKENLYFYLKTENNPELTYPSVRDYWVLDYYKDRMELLDQNYNTIISDENCIYITPPNVPAIYKSADKKPWVHSTITFEIDNSYMDSLDIPYMTPIYLPSTKELEQLMFDMESRLLSSSKFRQDELNSYMSLILYLIHDLLHTSDTDYKTQSGDDLQRIRHNIMNSTGVYWTIEKMASQANMSVRTFQRKYKELYGKTPIADLYDYRITRAKRLLDTGFSISHILNSCGFKSSQHFSRLFKQRTGMTPIEYKNRQTRD